MNNQSWKEQNKNLSLILAAYLSAKTALQSSITPYQLAKTSLEQIDLGRRIYPFFDYNLTTATQKLAHLLSEHPQVSCINHPILQTLIKTPPHFQRLFSSDFELLREERYLNPLNILLVSTPQTIQKIQNFKQNIDQPDFNNTKDRKSEESLSLSESDNNSISTALEEMGCTSDFVEEKKDKDFDKALSHVLPMVDPPPLSILTKEFPDWDLGKIAEFVNEGKTKNDLIARDLRSKKKETPQISQSKILNADDNQFSEEEMNLRLDIFVSKLGELFGFERINPDKAYSILSKNEFNIRKAFTLVKKNIGFYKKHFQNGQLFNGQT